MKEKRLLRPLQISERPVRGITLILCLAASAIFTYALGPRAWSLITTKSLRGEKNEAKIGKVTWHSTADPNIDVGNIIVPLDYSNYSAGTISISLGRRKSPLGEKRKGSIFLNPGGPGADGVSMAVVTGQYIMESRVGFDYDLIGFSPRGIGGAIPKVQCFKSVDDQQAFYANTVMELGFELPPNIGSLSAYADLLRQQTKRLAMLETQAKLCGETAGAHVLRYMGTTFVARDIEFMNRVLEGEDKLINYWSGSYGSILGAYLVNMFPDRVGRVSIDGIADPIEWVSKPSSSWYRGWISSTDTTYQMFLDQCVEAGYPACALASENKTAADIERQIDDFMDALYHAPLPVFTDARPALLTSAAARSVIFLALENPRSWTKVSQSLSDAMAGNGTTLISSLLRGGLSYGDDLSRTAVTCADSPPYSRENRTGWPTAESLTNEGIKALEEVSRRWAMSVTISEPDGGCQFWPANKAEDEEDGSSVERFTGPWNRTLKNSILIVSNTADPVTPIASGKLLHSLLRNSSSLLVQNSPGHTSLTQASLCTSQHSLRYFKDGTLPPLGTVCETEESPFNGTTKSASLSRTEQSILRSIRALEGLFQRRSGV